MAKGITMKKKYITRREFLKVGAGTAAGLMSASILGCGGGGGSETNRTTATYEAWSYQGMKSLLAVFETRNSTLYRQLLPSEFQMPEQLQVVVAVVSYDNVTLPLVAYYEGFVMIACKYQEQECLYTITMPVDDVTARDAGLSMGFPKYLASHMELVNNGGGRTGRVLYEGRTIIQIDFAPQSSVMALDTSNPGVSCVNLLDSGDGKQVVTVNTTGTQHIQRIKGTATVSADPSETWSGLLNDATLLVAQYDETTGNWLLTQGDELKISPVSIVKIKNGRIDLAVEEAIALLGGMAALTEGKQKIMLKPNLVTEYQNATTNPEVVRTVASLMQAEGKEVLIGEGSACATGYNLIGDVLYRTKNETLLDDMQQFVFDTLGYTDLAESLGIPLVNLHTGEMVPVDVPNGFVYDQLSLHRSLTEIDMLCSIPMMKTHTLAGVTLSMKNLIGVYPGAVYGSVRSLVHDEGVGQESSGAAAVTVDMVRANKLGLVVIDGSMAMEGNGPSLGDLIQMDLIIAGTNPLATDMVAASVMGFEPGEIPTFVWANMAGMSPWQLGQIEVRGQNIASVQRSFARPQITPWASIRDGFGALEI
jgi:uncharacterized protein (DUF362 family)